MANKKKFIYIEEICRPLGEGVAKDFGRAARLLKEAEARGRRPSSIISEILKAFIFEKKVNCFF